MKKIIAIALVVCSSITLWADRFPPEDNAFSMSDLDERTQHIMLDVMDIKIDLKDQMDLLEKLERMMEWFEDRPLQN